MHARPPSYMVAGMSIVLNLLVYSKGPASIRSLAASRIQGHVCMDREVRPFAGETSVEDSWWPRLRCTVVWRMTIKIRAACGALKVIVSAVRVPLARGSGDSPTDRPGEASAAPAARCRPSLRDKPSVMSDVSVHQTIARALRAFLTLYL